MAQFVVTGGGGFIGSNLVEAILAKGDRVRVIDNFATGRRSNLEAATDWARAGGGSFELVEGDIRDLPTCRRAVSGADYVLHQAAIPSVQRSVQDPLATNDVNVAGTLNLLVAARDEGVERFVMASSSSLYGESEVLPKVETMAPAPISPYGLQKLAGESYCGLFHRLYGLKTVALRYFNVFGPRQDPTSEYSAVIPLFVSAIKKGVAPTIFGDGGAFNIACGQRISLNELVGILAGFAGRKVAPVRAAHRPGDIKHSLAGIEKAMQVLGYSPTVSVRDGLRRTWDSL
jgi:nucleoside-diphosphate-sugar epimerase